MSTSTILFAHRGLHSSARENTLPAFSAAAKAGVSGLETDLWQTSDGVVVCDHDGTRRRFIRNISFSKLLRADLPDYVPEIEEVFEQVGVDFDYSFDVKDRNHAHEIISKVVDSFEKAGGDINKLWICHNGNDTSDFASWVTTARGANVVHSTPLKNIRGGPEKHASILAESKVAAINMPLSDWSLGLTALFHRFDLLAFAYSTRYERELLQAKSYEVDAVYSDNVPAMLQVFRG